MESYNDDEWVDVPVNEDDEWVDAPFEADDWGKVARAENDKLKEIERNKTSIPETMMRGGAQGLTLGNADEVSARLNALIDYGSAKLGMRGDISWNDAYKTNLNAIRKLDKKAEKDNPAAYKTAEIGGGILSPVSKIAPTSAMGRIGTAIGTGMVAGSGYSEGDFGSKEHLVDTGFGGAIGGVFSGAGEVVGKYGKDAYKYVAPKAKKVNDKVVDYLMNTAGRRATKAATGQNKKALQQIAAQKGGIEGFGKHLLDETVEVPKTFGKGTKTKNLVGYGDSVDSIASKARIKSKQAGEEINKILSKIDDEMPSSFSNDDLAMKIIEHADNNYWQPINKPIRDKLYQQADELLNVGDINLAGKGANKSAQTIKNSYQYKPSKGLPKPDELQPSVQNELKKIVGKQMDETVDAFDSGLKDQYLAAKKSYGPAIKTAELADERAIADLSNRFISPSDHAMGALAVLKNPGAVTDLATAFAMGTAALANKQVRTRGNAVVARSAKNLADRLARSPETFGKYAKPLLNAYERGPQAVASVHYALLKNDHNYINLIAALNAEDDKTGQMSAKPLISDEQEERKRRDK